MADWYVSSVNYSAVAVWTASHAYSIGDLVKPTAPAAGREYVFRCTVAGTSGATEPTWSSAPADNATIASGGATFTNVTGQSAYGWSAAAGTLASISGAFTNRPLIGDRVFVASDHGDNFTSASSIQYGFGSVGFGLIKIISVNRAGSVPPVQADVLAGATLSLTSTNTNSTLIIDATVDMYWEGLTFLLLGSVAANIWFNSQNKNHYLKNCKLQLSTTLAGSGIIANAPARVTLDNTTVKFGHTGQAIGNGNTGNFDITWINTPNAIDTGGSIPATLFTTASQTHLVTCRGVDLSAITGTLVQPRTQSTFGPIKVLFDNCKIAAGVNFWGTPNIGSLMQDELELVNCYDGTNFINERHSSIGDVTTDRGVTLSTGAAQDNIGAFSLKLASNAHADAVGSMDAFWLDVENLAIGASKTATVEVLSHLTLNNTDLRMLLEYMGTSGSPVVSFTDTLATILTAVAALSSSSATWTGASAVYNSWNPIDLTALTLSGNNLTASGGGGGVRAVTGFGPGKYYFEITKTTFTSAWVGVALQTNGITTSAGTTGAIAVSQSGTIAINGNNVGTISTSGPVCIAIDVGNKLIWFRGGTTGSWNAVSGSANDPATGTGGFDISSLVGVLFPYFIAVGGSQAITANFGASSFSGTPPSGFNAWLGTPATKQLLQATFTPQMAGRVRGLVRLCRPGTLAWINPRLTIT